MAGVSILWLLFSTIPAICCALAVFDASTYSEDLPGIYIVFTIFGLRVLLSAILLATDGPSCYCDFTIESMRSRPGRWLSLLMHCFSIGYLFSCFALTALGSRENIRDDSLYPPLALLCITAFVMHSIHLFCIVCSDHDVLMENTPPQYQQRQLQEIDLKSMRITTEQVNQRQVGECLLCFESYDEGLGAIEFACKHIFHEHCAAIWVTRNPNCPLCRATINSVPNGSTGIKIPPAAIMRDTGITIEA